MRIRLFFLSALLILSLGAVAQQTDCWDGSIAESYDDGDGTAQNPYQIATAEQLALLAQQTNEATGGYAYYILTNDICLNEDLNSTPKSWTPIGRVVEGEPLFFTGHFDGNNKTISGLYCDDLEGDVAVGLFGCTNDAEIINVNLSTCQVTSSKYAGSLVGHAGFTNISGCLVDHVSVVCEARSAGGLVGFFGLPYGVNEDALDTCRIVNCHVNQDVLVFGRLSGGLAGEIADYLLWGPSVPCLVSNCSSQATLEGTESVGGLVGFFRNGMMDSCICWNEVNSGQFAGGMVGCGIALNFANCVNAADVTGNYYCGGMVGKLYAGNFTHCENYGQINGGCFSGGGISEIGGIIGKFLPDPLLAGNDCENIVRDCHNYGQITNSGDYAGGIIGYSEASAIERLVIVDCSNTGRLHNNYGIAGGIIGYNHSFVMSVLNVYNTGTIGARYSVGGIAGETNTLMEVVMNVYSTGELVHEIENYACPRGAIVGRASEVGQYTYCYWLASDEYGSNGNGPELENSSAFLSTASPSAWQLEMSTNNTTDLLEALNNGVVAIEKYYPSVGQVSRWRQDTEFINGGFPVFSQQGTSAVDEQETEDVFQIYPNPTNGLIVVSGSQTGEYFIANLLGEILQTGRVDRGNHQIDLFLLPAGVYFINLAGQTLKFIKY